MERLSRLLIEALRADAARHEQGKFADLGCDFELVEHYQSQHPNEGRDKTVAIAHTFWDSWVDQFRHGFGQNFYTGIPAGAWPGLAKEIADNLETGTPVTNTAVLQYFDLTAR